MTKEIILSIITDCAIVQYYCGSVRKGPRRRLGAALERN